MLCVPERSEFCCVQRFSRLISVGLSIFVLVWVVMRVKSRTCNGVRLVSSFSIAAQQGQWLCFIPVLDGNT
eukprot:1769383-Amphidinium_carterae.1